MAQDVPMLVVKVMGEAGAAAPIETAAQPKYPKASTREGKKAITVYVEPETMKQIRHLLREEEDRGHDTTLQDLMIEALNALFEKRGVKRPTA